MNKVIGRYKSKYSGNTYDFITKTKAIVVKTSRSSYTIGSIVNDLYPYTKTSQYDKVETKIVIGGKIL